MMARQKSASASRWWRSRPGAWLWHAAATAKDEAAKLQQELARQTELYRAQGAAMKELQARNATLTAQVEAAATPAAAAGGPFPCPARAQGRGGGETGGGERGQRERGRKRRIDGADAERSGDAKAMRGQQEWMLKKQYAGLVKQLNLTPEQGAKFYAILLDEQDSNMEKGAKMLAGNDQEEIGKAVKEAQANTEAQLQALLGEDGFAKYNDYKTVANERLLLDQIKGDFTDNPLSAEQEQKLLQIMHAERQNAAHVPGQPDAAANPMDVAGNMERALQSQEEINAQVLQQAAAFLTPQQVQTLGTSQSQYAGVAEDDDEHDASDDGRDECGGGGAVSLVESNLRWM